MDGVTKLNVKGHIMHVFVCHLKTDFFPKGISNDINVSKAEDNYRLVVKKQNKTKPNPHFCVKNVLEMVSMHERSLDKGWL